MGNLTASPSLLVHCLIADLRISRHCMYREIDDMDWWWEKEVAEIAAMAEIEIVEDCHRVTAYIGHRQHHNKTWAALRVRFEQLEGCVEAQTKTFLAVYSKDWDEVSPAWRSRILHQAHLFFFVKGACRLSPLHVFG